MIASLAPEDEPKHVDVTYSSYCLKCGVSIIDVNIEQFVCKKCSQSFPPIPWVRSCQ